MENIFFTQHLAQEFRAWLQSQSFTHLCVLTDDNTLQFCYPRLAKALEGIAHSVITIRCGESEKNLETCSVIWEQWLSEHLDRKALVINLGGGVIGDMGGFCAATYKRGIRFLQMPTTLLAQVDASVGGKLGIDFQGYKNVIGTFVPPLAVWIDTVFLQTLPTRELQAGLAEVLKHCLIADEAQWKTLPETFLPAQMNWDAWVRHSIHIKHSIVSQDMDEQHIRKILNFGHTIGHAVETFFLNQKPVELLHGEAVALGIVAESFLSTRYTGLSQASYEAIANKINAYFPENHTFTQEEAEIIARLALQDKKNTGNTINCVMLEQVGKPVYDIKITEQDIVDSLRR
ncbi:MAG: 3-dehydroquinate synthase [Bacteroidetes bacterium]|nr:MAG: 3-dehydroquinate synthase [Bacteroidota bacterium]